MRLSVDSHEQGGSELWCVNTKGLEGTVWASSNGHLFMDVWSPGSTLARTEQGGL